MSPRRILSVVTDLYFATRIATVAKAVGAEIREADPGRALELARTEAFDLTVVDLHALPNVGDWVRELRSTDSGARASLVGFFSHVDHVVRDAALAAGVHQVLPRSAFTQQLAGLLSGTSGSRRDSLATPQAASILPTALPHRVPGASSMNAESSRASTASSGTRTQISCPGCGRNDYVRWPEGQETFHWKCFNCSKSFDLHRKPAH